MTVHHFQPKTYPNSFGPHAPVLRIADGDRVATTTIDAAGVDALGQEVAGRPNPQTGPFYIEGAEPGDTLVVHLDRLAPNRTTGWTKDVLAEPVVVAEGVRSLPTARRIEWCIDLDKNLAEPVQPLAGLAGFSIQLDPMLGCIGVAPEGGQAISSATSGKHGGNMDYRGVRTGATLYFPVFVPGALLHLGDGHAVQGAGEVVGTGIETAFEVQFTVHLLKGKRIHGPRGEDDDTIFTLGNDRPLDGALQHATTEMLFWLQEDYGLDVRAASILLGMCVEYEVGNVYDPAYTMVCKLAKAVLP